MAKTGTTLRDWKQVARHLGILEHDIINIEYTNKLNLIHQCEEAIILYWRESSGNKNISEKFEKLVKVLRNVDHALTAGNVQHHLLR